MSTTTDLTELKINVLTQAQYDSATKANDELYLTPAIEDISSQITFGGAWTQMVKVAYKVGKLVFFDLEGSTSTIVGGTQYTMATIASGYRPSSSIYLTGHTTNASYVPQAVVNAIAWTSGDITVRPSNANGLYFFVSGWYVIA